MNQTPHRYIDPCATLMMVLGASLAACAPISEPEVSAPWTGGVGSARMSLTLPASGPVVRVEYELTLTFLETSPPTVYAHETLPSLMPDGDLLTILPCRTGADGTGLNQVDILARIWLTPAGPPRMASTSEVFTCERNADVSVDVLVSIMGALDAGFADFNIQLGGVLCAAKVDWKPDTWSGVCAEASCGDAHALFLYATTCQTLSGDLPSFWVCGAPTEWSIVTQAAYSYFPVPEGDGRWTFGALGLDAHPPSEPDPSVVDASGARRVFRGLLATRATLEQHAGTSTSRIDEIAIDFAAVMTLPPRPGVLGTPEVLVQVRNQALGATLTWQTRYGRCDVPVDQTDVYPGLSAVDVRRDGEHAIDLYLGPVDADATDTTTNLSLATRVARCEARWDGSSPRVTCEASRPLEPGGAP